MSKANDTRTREPGTPVMVSQSTSEAVLGIDARRYLAHLRSHPELPRRRVGRLVVTRVADWLPASTERPQGARVYDLDEAIRKAVS